MVIKVTALPFQCEVCNKQFTTEKQAEKCESSHEVTRLKKEKEAANKMKLHDRLVEIRNTAESWQELQDKALEELKSKYGDDFVLVLPHNYTGWYSYNNGVNCTYAPSKKPKKNDYFNHWGGTGLDIEKILLALGFKTGSGNGDGKVYTYQVTCKIEDFRCIHTKMLERKHAVEDCCTKIKHKAEDYSVTIQKDEKYIRFTKDENELYDLIKGLKEKLEVTLHNKDEYIKDTYRDHFEKECSELINGLPQGFKKEHPDPFPLKFFEH